VNDQVFANNKLTSINLPASIEEIRGFPFAGNPLSDTFTVPAWVKWTVSYEGISGIVNGSGPNRILTVTAIGGLGSGRAKKIEIASVIHGIPVVSIAAGTLVGKEPSSYFDKPYRPQVDELVLPATLRVIAPGAFAFTDITKVTAPNQIVKTLWDEYYAQQKEFERTKDQEAFNRSVEQTRRQIDQMDKMIEGQR